MRLPRPVVAVLAALAIIPTVAVTAQQPAAADVDVYITEGTHIVNGREWRTDCEPYSQTERCRTEIKATVISYENGKFVATNGWAFNNLTYAPSPRSLWKGNPLGGYGSIGGAAAWPSADGRTWRTECDNDTTGYGGCRSYIQASVIESYKSSTGATSYRWVTKWLMNNMVRFTPDVPAAKPTPKPTPKPTVKPTPTKSTPPTPRPTTPTPTPNIPTPPATPTPTPPTPTPTKTTPTPTQDPRISAIVDENLRKCVARAAEFNPVDTIRVLDCAGVETLEGLPTLTGLSEFYLVRSHLTSLQQLPVLPSLTVLHLIDSGLTTLEGMPSLPALVELDVTDNELMSLEGMPSLPALDKLELVRNDLTGLDGMPSLPRLTELDLSYNPLAGLPDFPELPQLDAFVMTDSETAGTVDLDALPRTLTHLDLGFNKIEEVSGGIPGLQLLYLDGNRLTNVGSVATMTDLRTLRLDDNHITSVAPLAALNSLEELYLAGNDITDKETLQGLVESGTYIDIFED